MLTGAGCHEIERQASNFQEVVDHRKAGEIKGADLEKALANAEKALADADRKGDVDSIDDCLSALALVSSAAGKTIKKECDKKHKDVIAVLEKYDRLVTNRLEEAKASLAPQAVCEDEDGDEKGFGRLYLRRLIGKNCVRGFQTKPLNLVVLQFSACRKLRQIEVLQCGIIVRDC